MTIDEITASTTLQNTADKYDKLAKERKKREQIRKTRERLSKQQQQLVQLQKIRRMLVCAISVSSQFVTE